MNSIRTLGDISLIEYQSMIKSKPISNNNNNNNNNNININPNPLSLTPLHQQQVNQVMYNNNSQHHPNPFQQQQQQQQPQQEIQPMMDDRDIIIQSISGLPKRRRIDTPEYKSY